jgi:hypothetical protein
MAERRGVDVGARLMVLYGHHRQIETFDEFEIV